MYAKLMPMAIMVFFPFMCLIIIYVYKNNLDNAKVKSRVSNMFKNVNPKKSKYSVYFYPIWILRRLMFVVIPLALT